MSKRRVPVDRSPGLIAFSTILGVSISRTKASKDEIGSFSPMLKTDPGHFLSTSQPVSSK